MKKIKKMMKNKIVNIGIILFLIGFTIMNLGIIAGYITIGLFVVIVATYAITFYKVIKARR